MYFWQGILEWMGVLPYAPSKLASKHNIYWGMQYLWMGGGSGLKCR